MKRLPLLLPAVLAIASAGCGGDERPLTAKELRTSLGAADVGRVHVFSEPGRPDYVQVSVEALLLVRFESIDAATHVADNTRPTYRTGSRVQQMERVCNVLIYNLRAERGASRAAAERIGRTLRRRCG